MAKYLDSSGLTQVWNKAKETFLTPGGGDNRYFYASGPTTTVSTSYIDLDDYNSGNSNYLNLKSGTYGIGRTGYSETLVVFRSSGSTSALELKTSYNDTANLYYRKTIDSNRISGPWRVILSDVNYTSYTVTKTGSGASGTWGINISGNASTATNSSQLGGYSESSFLRYRDVASSSNEYETLWSQIGIREYHAARPNGITSGYTYGSVISLPGYNTRLDIWTNHQSSNSADDGIKYRSGWLDDKKQWLQLLDQLNYTNYTVKKDGTGASGTWGINISGNAATASSAGYTRKLYTSTWSGMDVWNDESNSLQLFLNGGNASGAPTGYPYGYLLNFAWSNGKWSGQIYYTVSDYESRIFTRGYRNDRQVWTDWNQVAFITDNVASATNASNVPWSGVSSKPDTATRWPSWSEITSKPDSFTPTAHDHDGLYLKLSGGTLSGNLTMSGNILLGSNYTYTLGSNTSEFKDAYIRQIGARHIDASAVYNGDRSLYIGYGVDNKRTTEATFFYYSKKSSDDTVSRTLFAEINSYGLKANTRLGVNGQDTGYNFYVNGTSYLKGNTIIRGTEHTPLQIISGNTNYCAINLKDSSGVHRTIGINQGELFITDKSNWSQEYRILHSGNYTSYINSTNFPGLAGVRSVSINGNYLRVNTNGSNSDLTIPYATNAGNTATVNGYTYNFSQLAIFEGYEPKYTYYWYKLEYPTNNEVFSIYEIYILGDANYAYMSHYFLYMTNYSNSGFSYYLQLVGRAGENGTNSLYIGNDAQYVYIQGVGQWSCRMLFRCVSGTIKTPERVGSGEAGVAGGFTKVGDIRVNTAAIRTNSSGTVTHTNTIRLIADQLVGNITGEAGSVAWSNITSKPASATRWPSWGEVTDKPNLFNYINTNYDSSYNADNLNTFSCWSAKQTQNVPNFPYGALISFPYNIGDTTWNKQIYMTNGDSSNPGIYARWNYNGTWRDWKRILIESDNLTNTEIDAIMV